MCWCRNEFSLDDTEIIHPVNLVKNIIAFLAKKIAPIPFTRSRDPTWYETVQLVQTVQAI